VTRLRGRQDNACRPRPHFRLNEGFSLNERLLEICEADRPKVVEIVEQEVAAALEGAKKPRKKRLPKEGEEDWVSLKSLFGVAKIPLAVAEVIADAIDKMMSAGDITSANKWQWMEYVAIEYLNGVEIGALQESDEGLPVGRS
jgi:hypothetical protein